MFDLIHKLLAGQNRFASGGLLLMIVGALGVSVRALPVRLWEWLLGQITMMITVKDDDPVFRWVKEWFAGQPFLKRVRRVDLDTTLHGEELALIPAPGLHFFWYARRPFWVWFYRSEDTKGLTARRAESLTFRTMGREQAVLKRFVDEVVACHKRKARLASYLYMYDSGWMHVQAYAPRLLESVILNSGETEQLKQDVKMFLQSRQRYRALGVPYHRGYLLFGPPGTGKTSLVSGLAAEFGMSIYAVNLIEFNDRTLKFAINEVPEYSIILFEDIDCMRTGDARPQSGGWAKEIPSGGEQPTNNPAASFGVTLSGLLNVLDGLGAPENVLFVMTTNRIEVLDEALLRPGRIDYRLFLGEAEEPQKIELYRRFFPYASHQDAVDFVKCFGPQTMAEFQGLLLSLGWDEVAVEQEHAGGSCSLRE